jgi:hypothetical protein
MAQFEVTIRFRYTMTDDMKLRKEIYGCTDLYEMAAIDATMPAADLLVLSEDSEVAVEVKPVIESETTKTISEG